MTMLQDPPRSRTHPARQLRATMAAMRLSFTWPVTHPFDVRHLRIDPGGGIRCLYDEALDLTSFGPLKVSRGSHVEPTSDGQWTADLSPVAGPVLGPYPYRTAALAAERE